MSLEVVILAAGKGTRMYSDLPKVLHPLAGKPLLAHAIDVARALQPAAVHVVYGFGGDRVPRAFPDGDVRWVLQAEQRAPGMRCSRRCRAWHASAWCSSSTATYR